MDKKTNRCRVIALCNQKGGVGKTTSAVALSAAIAKEGYKVLLIDNDPQANSTESLGLRKPDGMQITISSIFEDLMSFKAIPTGKGIVETNEQFNLLPADNTYSGIEISLISMMNREYFMKSYIDGIKKDYDYIFIDCPPNLGMLTVNALTASDELVIPAQPQKLSALSVQQLLHTVNMVRQFPNKDLKVNGIFFTMFDGRRNEDKMMLDGFKRGFDLHLYTTTIPTSVKAAEAVTRKQSVVAYEPNCKVALAYKQLAIEVINNG